MVLFSQWTRLIVLLNVHSLLRDNYQDLNSVATRLEQHGAIQTSNTQLTVNPSDTTDENPT